MLFLTRPPTSLYCPCLGKRSRALRGRNPTRDTQTRRCRQGASGPRRLKSAGGPFFATFGHQSHASKIPGLGQSPSNHPIFYP